MVKIKRKSFAGSSTKYKENAKYVEKLIDWGTNIY